tara:strand:+ start:423 stop:1022 length:600 start_codon:yes stop_codon:yes gene_type:complete
MAKKKQSELFEQTEEEMEEVEEEEVEEVEAPPPPAKKPRKKRVLTEEQKEKLRENLKKGREKSLETRRRNKQLKSMDKDKAKDAKDAELYDHLKAKKEKVAREKKSAVSENESLKKRLDEMEQRFSSLNSKTLSPIKEDETEEPSNRKIIEKVEKSQSASIEKSPKKEELLSISVPPTPPKIHSSLLAGGLSLDALRLM